jgi:hypothetical protein
MVKSMKKYVPPSDLPEAFADCSLVGSREAAVALDRFPNAKPWSRQAHSETRVQHR